MKKVKSFNLACILSEDAKYKLWFFMSYLPDLYRRHTRKNFKNCLFCSRLIKSGCHRYCLKCGAGTYIQCSPPLPGLLYEVTVHMVREDVLRTRGTSKKPAPASKASPVQVRAQPVFRVPSIALNNYEALEGLEGPVLGAGRSIYARPSITASIRNARGNRNMTASVSCMKIVNELKRYMKTSPGIQDMQKAKSHKISGIKCRIQGCQSW